MFDLGYAVGFAAIPLLVGVTAGYFAKGRPYLTALAVSCLLCVILKPSPTEWPTTATAAAVCAAVIGIFYGIRRLTTRA